VDSLTQDLDRSVRLLLHPCPKETAVQWSHSTSVEFCSFRVWLLFRLRLDLPSDLVLQPSDLSIDKQQYLCSFQKRVLRAAEGRTHSVGQYHEVVVAASWRCRQEDLGSREIAAVKVLLSQHVIDAEAGGGEVEHVPDFSGDLALCHVPWDGPPGAAPPRSFSLLAPTGRRDSQKKGLRRCLQSV